jgi:two-component system, NtrC family, response regulator AtoC
LHSGTIGYVLSVGENMGVTGQGSVLVVDDEATSRTLMVRWLEREGCNVEPFADAESCLDALGRVVPEAICLDLELPGMSGLEALIELKKRAPRVPVIILTATREVETVVQAMQSGAYDYITKSPDRTKLVTTIRNAIANYRLSTRVESLEREVQGRGFHSLVGQSANMRSLYRELDRVSASDVTVLVNGESGTGKELVARAIHEASARSRGPFVSVNCAAVPENLQESEFFGHERGAFTGANARRLGHFELANSGTLFLDEVGELSSTLQAKLLRALQERSFQRVGGTEVRSDFRLLTATHRDLSADVATGRFRQDLYFRIAVFEIAVPPLRDRGNDIETLAQHFVQIHAKGRALSLSPEAIELLKSHGWPGNVRELQNAIQRATVVCDGDVIEARDLPLKMRTNGSPVAITTPSSKPSRPSVATALRPRKLAEVQKRALIETLSATNGNISEAVRQLGIGRTTFYRMMKRHGIR